MIGQIEKELKHLQAFHEDNKILGGAFELAELHWEEVEESKYARLRSHKILAETESIRKKLNFDYVKQEKSKKKLVLYHRIFVTRSRTSGNFLV